MTRWTGVLVLVVVLLGALGGLGSCRERAEKRGGPLRAVVTVPPLKGVLEPLMPPGSTVTILMQPGRSEHGYEFTPSDIAQLAGADLVVYVGLGLEGKLDEVLAKQNVPDRQVVNFAEAIDLVRDDPHDHAGHGHAEDEHDHDHDHDHAVDPHLWLDPVLVDALVGELSAALIKAAGVRGVPVESELARLDPLVRDLRERIKAVDSAWKAGLKPFEGRAIVTHHNAFPRPAERYGFKVAAVVREFESEPSPGDLAKVVDAIRAQGVKVIFVEPQYNAAAAEKIAQVAGVRVATLDPLGDGDWFGLMQKNLDSLVSNLADGAPAPASSAEQR